MSDSRPRPQLSNDANIRLNARAVELEARIFEDARRLAEGRGLDTVSPVHIDEAVNNLVQGFTQPSSFKGWADTVGGLVLGIALQGFYTELFSQAPMGRGAVTVSALCLLLGCGLVAWAKYPTRR